MIDLDKSIQRHRFEVDNLFRSYKLNGTQDIEKIRAGFESFGESFILKLLSIIVPKEQTSHFEGTLEAKLPSPEIAGLQTPTSYSTTAGTTTAGKGWTFWEKFLGAATNTGEAVGKILNNVNNPQQTAEQQAQALQIQQTEAASNKTLYVIAGSFLAAIILIFAFKK